MLALMLAFQFATCGEAVGFSADPGTFERLPNPERVVLSGKARIFQCDRLIEAPRIIAYVEGQDLHRVDIPEEARVTIAGQTSQAGWAVVDFEAGLATLGGGVTVSGGGYQLECDLIEIVLDRGLARCLPVGRERVKGAVRSPR